MPSWSRKISWLTSWSRKISSLTSCVVAYVSIDDSVDCVDCDVSVDCDDNLVDCDVMAHMTVLIDEGMIEEFSSI